MSDRNQHSMVTTALRERNILKNVYLWMTCGLSLTGIIALGVSTSERLIYVLASNPGIFYGLIIGELVLVFFISSRIMKLSPAVATFSFVGYSALNGVTLALIFQLYTGQSITTALFITAGTFGAMSIYALTTKRDLSGIGHFLIMGLWGVIIASLVNLFLGSEILYWIISYIGVAVFLGLTAYDTQTIKRWSSQMGDSLSEQDYIRFSILGALKLYLDFINLFLFFLRIFGRRR